ncbi:MAG: hypothetical protein ACHBN1_18960 [Heteroscytonema crispum UTEX LB 1556]
MVHGSWLVVRSQQTTTNTQQRDRASPVAWVGKSYQGREVCRRESSRLQTSRPNTHQPTSKNSKPKIIHQLGNYLTR